MSLDSWRRRAALIGIGLCAATLLAATFVSTGRWIHRPFPGFFVHTNLTVGPYFLPQWSGRAAGLNTLDRVIAVNHLRLVNREQLYETVRRSPAGTVFRYTVVRGEEQREFDIPSMTFAFHDWLLSFGLFVLVGLAFLIIGVAPYYYRSSSPAVFPLCFMVVNVFVWFASTFDFMTSGAWPKELRIFAFTFTPGAGIHLGLLLREGRPLWNSRRGLLVTVYGVSVVLGSLYSWTLAGPTRLWIPIFRAGYVYSCLAALVFLWLIGSSLAARSSDVERSRLRVMLVGALLGFFLPTLGAVLTSSFRWPIPYNVSLIPTIFFPLSVAYGLIKYSLFELGNALKLGLSRFGLFVALVILYVAVVLVLGPTLGIYDQEPLIPIFFAIVVVALFNPVLRWIEGVVDRLIFRQEYDPVEVQKEISLFLRSLAGARELATGFLGKVNRRLGLEGGGLIYRPQGSERLVAILGVPETDVEALLEKGKRAWRDRIRSGYQGLSRYELINDPEIRERESDFAEIFEAMRAEILFPIVFQHEVRGVVGFGAKERRQEYTAEDLRLLGTLSDQLALALENGDRYEESERRKEEYRRLYDEAETAKRRLIESDRIKKQFVANLCHELRTPVSTIIGFGEILLDPGFRGDARAILERMMNNGQDLSRLMDNLLDFSRLEAEALPNRLEPVNIREVMLGLEMMTRRLIRGRPIQFRVHLDSAVDTIQSDPRKLQQILMQLLTNALKFTLRGEVEVRVKTITDPTGPWVEISVTDTGIGIDRKDHELIFEEFRQLDGSSTRQYGGTGLGLSLCRKLAHALGGKINVDSKVGAGSVFSLILPLAAAEPSLAAS